MRVFGIGVVGCGAVTTGAHVPAIKAAAGLSLVAVADREASRLAGFTGVETYADYQELIADPAVDAVAVCVPPMMHHDVAAAVLAAGKALFLEKPIALTLADADALVALSDGHLAALGYNQRHHPDLVALREAIDRGELGTVQSIAVRWSHHGVAGQRGWMASRESGGGALRDLGGHQLDLWQFLLRDRIAEVTAVSSSRDFDDQGAVLSARMKGGAVASATLTTCGEDAYEIRVDGTAGSRVVRPYPRFQESYVRQWSAFGSMLAGGEQELATLADGRDALRWILQVLPKPTEREGSAGLRGSVILTTNRNFESLRKSVSVWRQQTIASQLEMVLVMPKGADEVRDEAFAGFASGRVVVLEGPFYAGAAYAAGVRAARGEVVILGEDHAFPEADCAERLLAVHGGGGVTAVGPYVVNANPRTMASWADHLLGYGAWHGMKQATDLPFIPGHNSSYRRDVLLHFGDRLDVMLQSETVMHLSLHGLGHRLRVEPSARIRNFNFSRWSAFFAVRVDGGRAFAAIRSRDWTFKKRIAFAALTPLLPVVRLSRILRTVDSFSTVAALPLVAAGLVLDAWGQWLGTLWGSGAAFVRLARIEYNRVDFIVDGERSFWNSQ